MNGVTARVFLSGEVDMAVGPPVTEAIRRALAMRPDRVVVELGAVTFLDSFGIRAIVTGYHDAVRAGTGFAMGPAAPNITRILAMTGLSDGLTAAPAVNK